ncbi:alpha/beta hydrolase [Saccharibacillus sp. JS10]|uniref:alpha/beta hydrolase n=1 Tax=Saccharibacillus sp. JS10 TaxID=2950552 RepID=UPI002108B817|nr:alpha/beta hydrolase [Saccharibacillus sp. JS10]MCQ4086725.1 alpha/beta hydrolase [Saccharibacillus sp. JS10]
MRKYSSQDLEILKNQTSVQSVDGVDVVIKPSPGEERPGYIDPAELEIMKQHWVGDLGSRNEKNAEKPPIEAMLPIIRESMGFPNYNLNTVEIHTRYEELTDSGNTVGLWRHYPRKSPKENRPALVFFHGGGWIGGSVYTVENICRLIAELADAVVFNVDYSLAPEKPYPHGFNDNYNAVKHIYDHAEAYGIDRDRIAIGGDSAGGNYAAAVCLKAKEEGTPKIALQVLIYPCVAMADASVEGYEWKQESFDIAPEHADILLGGLLSLGKPSKRNEDPMMNLYLPEDADVTDPYISPMLAKSHKDLPPALLIGAEFDGVRIQTEFYAKQLAEAGVQVRCLRYKGMTHAFMDKLGHVAQAEDLCIEVADAIKAL